MVCFYDLGCLKFLFQQLIFKSMVQTDPSHISISSYSKLLLQKCSYGVWLPHFQALITISFQGSWQNMSSDDGATTKVPLEEAIEKGQ